MKIEIPQNEKITQSQFKYIETLVEQLNMNKIIRDQEMSAIAGRKITSIGELTKKEASAVISIFKEGLEYLKSI